MTLFSLLFDQPLLALLLIIIFLFALSFHEFSHALMSYWLGDNTAQRAKRLTMNPLAHVDVLGFLALITVGFGWGKPVPFNPLNLKNRRWGPVLVATAGPLSNLLLGTLCALAFRFLWPLYANQPNNLLIMALVYATHLNFLLLLFNLIPIPPLDGSKFLLAIVAAPAYRRFRDILETKGPLILLGLILVDNFIGLNIFGWIGKAANGMFNLIAGIQT